MADHQLQLPLRLFHGCEILMRNAMDQSTLGIDRSLDWIVTIMQLGCLNCLFLSAFSSKRFTSLTSPLKVLIKWPQDSALPIVEELSHHHCPLSAIPPPTFQCQHGPSHTRGSMRNKFKHIQSVCLEIANTTDCQKKQKISEKIVQREQLNLVI